MKRKEFDKLFPLDESLAERISSHAAFSEKEMNAVFEKSCEKADNTTKTVKAKTGKDNFEVIELESARFRFTPLRTAAACLAVLVIGGGVFGMIKNYEPLSDKGETEKIIDSDRTDAETTTEESSALTEEPVKEQSAVSSSAEKPETSNSSAAASSSKTGESSSAVSKPKTGSSSAAENPKTSDSSAAVEQPQTSEVYITEENPNDGGETVSKPKTSDSSAAVENPQQPDSSDTETIESGYDNIVRVTSENVLKITPEMTYAEVIAFLGKPDTLGVTNGYAQYIIDGERLLMLFYENKGDEIGVSGEVLLSTAPRVDEMYKDGTAYTFDCYVVRVIAGGSDIPYTMRVCCPQMVGNECADIRFNIELSEYISLQNVKPGCGLRVECDDVVEESYPCRMFAHSVDVIK